MSVSWTVYELVKFRLTPEAIAEWNRHLDEYGVDAVRFAEAIHAVAIEDEVTEADVRQAERNISC